MWAQACLQRCCGLHMPPTPVTHLSVCYLMEGCMQAHGGQGRGVSPAGPRHKGQAGQSVSGAAAWWAVSCSSLPSALILLRPGSCSGMTHVMYPGFEHLCNTTIAC